MTDCLLQQPVRIPVMSHKSFVHFLDFLRFSQSVDALSGVKGADSFTHKPIRLSINKS